MFWYLIMLYHSFVSFFHAYLDTSTFMHNMTHPHLCIPWHIHLYAYNDTSMHSMTHSFNWHMHIMKHRHIPSHNIKNAIVRMYDFLIFYKMPIKQICNNENFIKNSCIYSLQIVFHTSLQYSLTFFSIHYQTPVHYLWHVYAFLLIPTKCLKGHYLPKS